MIFHPCEGRRRLYLWHFTFPATCKQTKSISSSMFYWNSICKRREFIHRKEGGKEQTSKCQEAIMICNLIFSPQSSSSFMELLYQDTDPFNKSLYSHILKQFGNLRSCPYLSNQLQLVKHLSYATSFSILTDHFLQSF